MTHRPSYNHLELSDNVSAHVTWTLHKRSQHAPKSVHGDTKNKTKQNKPKSRNFRVIFSSDRNRLKQLHSIKITSSVPLILQTWLRGTNWTESAAVILIQKYKLTSPSSWLNRFSPSLTFFPWCTVHSIGSHIFFFTFWRPKVNICRPVIKKTFQR